MNIRPQGQGRMRTFHKVSTHRVGARWPPEVVSSLVNTTLEGWNLSRTALSHQSLPVAQKHPKEGKQSGNLNHTENVQKANLKPPCCCPQRGAARTGLRAWERRRAGRGSSCAFPFANRTGPLPATPLGRLKPNLLL